MTHDRLDLVSKLYQPTGWPRILQAAAGEPSSAPLVVDLDPTTFCDLACPECISGKLLNQGRFTPNGSPPSPRNSSPCPYGRWSS